LTVKYCVVWSSLVILLGSASALAESASTSQPLQKAEPTALFPSARRIKLGRSVAASSLEPVLGTSSPDTSGQADAPDPIETPTTETPEDDPFLGIRKAMKKCTKCHGETGNSSRSGMPNLTAQDPEHFVTSMQTYVDGSRKHKMMKKLVGRLDEQTIHEMGVFYAVQEPLRSETQGEGDANAGRRLSDACANCHGADGNASGKGMPTLAGQDARYFVKTMKAYRDGKRQHMDMIDATQMLNDRDFINLATFYAAVEPVRREIHTPLKSAE